MDCCSKLQEDNDVRKAPLVEEEQQLLLTIRSPLLFGPDAEYHVVWAKRSLWKRRLEGLQQRHKKLEEEDDDDDATWLMDASQSTLGSDRWGENPNLTVSRLEEDDNDNNNGLTQSSSCPHLFDRWSNDCQPVKQQQQQQQPSSTDNAPSVPSRPASPQLSEDESSDDSSSSSEQNSPPHTVAWLDDLYSTVREIRARRSLTSEEEDFCSTVREIRAARRSSCLLRREVLD